MFIYIVGGILVIGPIALAIWFRWDLRYERAHPGYNESCADCDNALIRQGK